MYIYIHTLCRCVYVCIYIYIYIYIGVCVCVRLYYMVRYQRSAGHRISGSAGPPNSMV